MDISESDIRRYARAKDLDKLSEAIWCADNHEVRRIAAAEIGGTKDPALFNILTFAIWDSDDMVREIASHYLKEMDENRAVNYLEGAYKTKNRGLRLDTVRALGDIGNKKAAGTLIRALSGKDDVLRAAAAEALGKIKDTSAVEPLIDVLNDRNVWVQRNAAYALASIGDPRACIPIARMIEDVMIPWMREVISQSLSNTCGPDTADEFIELLEDKQDESRWCFAIALGIIGNPKAYEALAKALEDESEKVREAAQTGLNMLDRYSEE